MGVENPAPDDIGRERTIALKGTIRLLAQHAEREERERHELAEFAIDLVDRVVPHRDGELPAT